MVSRKVRMEKELIENWVIVIVIALIITGIVNILGIILTLLF